MGNLNALSCPSCNSLIAAVEYLPGSRVRPQSATSYASCLRRCEPCGIGYSNARDSEKAVVIYRDPLANIPQAVRAGAREALSHALNILNRTSKLKKFAFETSEDAITWTVFRHLQAEGLLRAVLRGCRLPHAASAAGEPELLLWGVPVPAENPSGRLVQEQLTAILDGIGDNPKSRSEPDVVLDFGQDGLVVIEVKHRSGNDIKPTNYYGWQRYRKNTAAFTDTNRLCDTGLYELARNWRIGWELAKDRSFTLVNLAPAEFFQGPQCGPLAEFQQCLAISERTHFLELTWDQVIAAIPQKPDWLGQHLRARRVGLASL